MSFALRQRTTKTSSLLRQTRRPTAWSMISKRSISSICRGLSSSSSSLEEPEEDNSTNGDSNRHQRVWKAQENSIRVWNDRVMDNAKSKETLLERIEQQEHQGGRMLTRQLGVLHEDPQEDMRQLVENYTVTSLASALRDREDVLQLCAQLAKDKNWAELAETLENHHPDRVAERRRSGNVVDTLDRHGLEVIRRALMRMPRRVTQAHSRRAGVVIPIAKVNGVPSILLEKRSQHMRAHADEVCLPGGMVCNVNDTTIVATCLREMDEEIEGLGPISVLGVLRCNWGEVHHLVGVAVTPVVCYLGEVGDLKLKPNPDEVAEIFSIPMASLMDKDLWIHKDGLAPIFLGGPHVIWGLTGYILERFWKDILLPSNVLVKDDE